MVPKKKTTTPEPWDAARALREWPDQRGHWTPLSWTDHRHEFNVFFDGTLVASSYGAYGFSRRATGDELAQGFSLHVKPHAHAEPDPGDLSAAVRRYRNPSGIHRAWWADTVVPQMVIEHSLPGILIEQRQFATADKSGVLMLWVRLEIRDVLELVNDLNAITLALTPMSDHMTASMEAFNNILHFNRPPHYPVALEYEGPPDLSAPGMLSLERQLFGARHRMAIAGTNAIDARVTWHRIRESLVDHLKYLKQSTEFEHLAVQLPCRTGSTLDLLVPYACVDDDVLNRALGRGFDGALALADEHWKARLATKVSLYCPEPLVQGHLRHFAPLSMMIAEQHPENDETLLVSGSFAYEATWPTPMALQCVALDWLGYHDFVRDALEPYRRCQGSVKPPSHYLGAHPGYFGNPVHVRSVDWISDHGAVLFAACRHALLSRDRAFYEGWLDALLKAAEWIGFARHEVEHGGRPGLLPAGVTNDALQEEQQIWNDAWAFKGLAELASLLRYERHPRASDITDQAADYREAIRAAMLEGIAGAPRWTDARGTTWPLVPTAPGEAVGSSMKHAFYLDTGPMLLVWCGLFDADEPIMQALLAWFRDGPQRHFYRPLSNPWQVPVLDREISSCEPCYSWNIFHALQSGDRHHFAMGLYGLLAAGASQATFVSSETREGVFGNVFSTATFIHAMVPGVVEETDHELRLLGMIPTGFLKDGGIDWKSLPTRFGPLSIKARIDRDSTTMHVSLTLPGDPRLESARLNTRPDDSIRTVLLNGSPVESREKWVEIDTVEA